MSAAQKGPAEMVVWQRGSLAWVPDVLLFGTPRSGSVEDSPQSQSSRKSTVQKKGRPKGYVAWTLCEVTSKVTAEGFVTVSTSEGKKAEVSLKDLEPANPKVLDGIDDIASLSYLNHPCLVQNLRLRYQDDLIYTFTGPLLIAVNPFKELPDLYSEAALNKYRKRRLGEAPPHVYAIADVAYETLLTEGKSQSIVISGESGSGKTETTKYVMRYLARMCGSVGKRLGELEARILESNPITEAFGNAKTPRNNNSSRFGKFIRIHFSERGKIIGATIDHYLLEKSRVVHQEEGSRNFHIFYQLCAGATPLERVELDLTSIKDYRYTKSTNPAIPGVNDGRDFARTRAALDACGFSKKEQMDIWQVLAGILHLGNVEFRESDAAEAETHPDAKVDLEIAARLLGVAKVEALEAALCKRTIKAGMESYTVSKNAREAEYSRDALAKAVYVKLFDWLLDKINVGISGSLRGDKGGLFVGILDIFGFEMFDVNGFEQLCINFANERLQQFFNNYMFKLEQQEYEREGIDWSYIDFNDNQDVLNLIEGKPEGILGFLDEDCLLPSGSDMSFAQKLDKKFENHELFEKPKLSQSSFILHHSAGEVWYDCTGFVDKNKDSLFADLSALMQGSTQSLVKTIFTAAPAAPATPKGGGARAARAAHFISVSSKFRDQVNALMKDLGSTHPLFIRCIKPSNISAPGNYDSEKMVDQLRCAGVLEAVKISRSGYPSRCLYQDIVTRYALLKPKLGVDKIASERTGCEKLLIALEINSNQYQFGYTKAFFKSGILAYLEQLRGIHLFNQIALVQKIWRGRQIRLWYKAARHCIIVSQTIVRRHQAVKRVRTVRRETRASIVIVRNARMFLARRQVKATMRRVVLMQALVRGKSARHRAAEISKYRAEGKAVPVELLVSPDQDRRDSASTYDPLTASRSRERARTNTMDLALSSDSDGEDAGKTRRGRSSTMEKIMQQVAKGTKSTASCSIACQTEFGYVSFEEHMLVCDELAEVKAELEEARNARLSFSVSDISDDGKEKGSPSTHTKEGNDASMDLSGMLKHIAELKSHAEYVEKTITTARRASVDGGGASADALLLQEQLNETRAALKENEDKMAREYEEWRLEADKLSQEHNALVNTIQKEKEKLDKEVVALRKQVENARKSASASEEKYKILEEDLEEVSNELVESKIAWSESEEEKKVLAAALEKTKEQLRLNTIRANQAEIAMELIIQSERDAEKEIMSDSDSDVENLFSSPSVSTKGRKSPDNSQYPDTPGTSISQVPYVKSAPAEYGGASSALSNSSHGVKVDSMLSQPRSPVSEIKKSDVPDSNDMDEDDNALSSSSSEAIFADTVEVEEAKPLETKPTQPEPSVVEEVAKPEPVLSNVQRRALELSNMNLGPKNSTSPKSQTSQPASHVVKTAGAPANNANNPLVGNESNGDVGPTRNSPDRKSDADVSGVQKKAMQLDALFSQNKGLNRAHADSVGSNASRSERAESKDSVLSGANAPSSSVQQKALHLDAMFKQNKSLGRPHADSIGSNASRPDRADSKDSVLSGPASERGISGKDSDTSSVQQKALHLDAIFKNKGMSRPHADSTESSASRPDRAASKDSDVLGDGEKPSDDPQKLETIGRSGGPTRRSPSRNFMRNRRSTAQSVDTEAVEGGGEVQEVVSVTPISEEPEEGAKTPDQEPVSEGKEDEEASEGSSVEFAASSDDEYEKGASPWKPENADSDKEESTAASDEGGVQTALTFSWNAASSGPNGSESKATEPAAMKLYDEDAENSGTDDDDDDDDDDDVDDADVGDNVDVENGEDTSHVKDSSLDAEVEPADDDPAPIEYDDDPLASIGYDASWMKPDSGSSDKKSSFDMPLHTASDQAVSESTVTNGATGNDTSRPASAPPPKLFGSGVAARGRKGFF